MSNPTLTAEHVDLIDISSIDEHEIEQYMDTGMSRGEAIMEIAASMYFDALTEKQTDTSGYVIR